MMTATVQVVLEAAVVGREAAIVVPIGVEVGAEAEVEACGEAPGEELLCHSEEAEHHRQDEAAMGIAEEEETEVVQIVQALDGTEAAMTGAVMTVVVV